MAAETDVRNCKVGKLVFYFSNDGAKTCSAQKVLAIHFFFFNSKMAAETDVRNCKGGKLVFYFSNDGAKTCSYGPKISRNIEIKYLFHFNAYFDILGTFHTSCMKAFNLLF